MPNLPSLSEDAGLYDVFRLDPALYQHWLRFSDLALRRRSELSPVEREMLSLFVSRLNGAAYTAAAGEAALELAGGAPARVARLVADDDEREVGERLRPIFRLARKLAADPASVSRADTKAVLDQGWTEETLHQVVLVVCRAAFVDRLAIASGLVPPDAATSQRLAHLRLRHGFTPMVESLAREAGGSGGAA
ncbi:MAG: carboxymuconolactone decarboxylase family protein [Azospirillaceae bacterium]